MKVDNTGQTRTINGQVATEMIVTMTAKQATAQGQMIVKSEDWLAPAQPGSDELRAFQKKLAEKYAYAMVALPGGMAGASKGLSEAMKQAMSQDRYPRVNGHDPFRRHGLQPDGRDGWWQFRPERTHAQNGDAKWKPVNGRSRRQ